MYLCFESLMSTYCKKCVQKTYCTVLKDPLDGTLIVITELEQSCVYFVSDKKKAKTDDNSYLELSTVAEITMLVLFFQSIHVSKEFLYTFMN